jgi:hypothetical protein
MPWTYVTSPSLAIISANFLHAAYTCNQYIAVHLLPVEALNLRVSGWSYWTHFLVLRFKVLTPVKMSILFWFVTPCGLASRYQRFGETCCLYLQDWSEGGWHLPTNPHGVTTQKNNIGVFLVGTYVPKSASYNYTGWSQMIWAVSNIYFTETRQHTETNLTPL